MRANHRDKIERHTRAQAQRYPLPPYCGAALAFAALLVSTMVVSPLNAQNSPQAATEAPTPMQLKQPPGNTPSGAPVTITLQDALARAKKYNAQFIASSTDAKIANEDRIQARAAMLPSASESTQFLGTQGNGITPNGRFVTQDGVHVYREWGVFKEDLSPGNYMLTTYRRAAAVTAISKAKADIAERGLNVTVTRSYYALLVAQRKYATAQQSLTQAKRFLDITGETERGGQAPHSDVIKAQIQYNQQDETFQDAALAMENARLDLGVLLFPDINENFTLVDDLDSPQALPPFDDVQRMAEHENPDLRIAEQSLRAAQLDVTAAKGAFLPSLSLETDYGIEANSFALRSRTAADPGLGRLPNLGYFLTASLNIPFWDWGILHSKLHQAEFKKQQAEAESSEAQRQMVNNLYSYYNEASVAQHAVGTLRQTADLAAESFRLVTLRYQAGESGSLEVVDAQNTLTQARNAYNDAEARYRLALANLQTLTGSF